MKTIIGYHMFGSFPGSPDHDYYFVDEETANDILNLLKLSKSLKFDTMEDAIKKMQEQENGTN